MKSKTILELGSGFFPTQFEKKHRVYRIDKRLYENTTFKVDIEKEKIPVTGNYFDEAHAVHLLEHIENLEFVMREVNRVLKPWGRFYITVPYFRSHYAFADPTHRRQFTYGSFGYFNESYYEDMVLFNVVSTRFSMIGAQNVIGSAVVWFANCFPRAYERLLSPLFPVDELVVVLEKWRK